MEDGGLNKLRKTSSEKYLRTYGLFILEETGLSQINGNHISPEKDECTVREQDRFLPTANIVRIMRKVLPPQAKISDEAKETIQECVSEYISFVTGEANQRCKEEQRKTVTAEDVIWAMDKLGLDNYVQPLTAFLNHYRELEGDRGYTRGNELTLKRTAEVGGWAFGPPLYVRHDHGFYEYLKTDESSASSSQAAAGSEEPKET